MQWKRVQFVLLIVCAVLPGKLVAQTESPDYAALQAELDQNRAVWDASKGDAYRMTITRQCFCPVEALGPFVLTVVNGVITSVEPDNQFSDGLPTVDGVFDEIQDAINSRAAQVTVSYDATLGYPMNVFIDQDFMTADEEIGYEISVELIDGGETQGDTPGTPAPQCDPSLVTRRAPVVQLSRKALTNGFSIGQYTSNLLKWRSYLQSINCVYKYRLTRSCFCTPEFVGPYIISVENGVVVDAVYDGDLPGIQVPTDLPTITQLFKIILDEAQEADAVEITYDSETGVPTSAFFDRLEGAVDDEITYLAELL